MLNILSDSSKKPTTIVIREKTTLGILIVTLGRMHPNLVDIDLVLCLNSSIT